MGKFGLVMCCFASGVLGAGLVWFLLSQQSYTVFGGRALPAANVDITYGGFIAVLLGVVTIVLACLAIAVGIVAGLTFENIKKMYDGRLSQMIEIERDKLEKKMRSDIVNEIAAIAYGASGFLNGNGQGAEVDDPEEDETGR